MTNVSFYRHKMNSELSKRQYSGLVLDLGGGSKRSDYPFLSLNDNYQSISINNNTADMPTVLADLEGGIPFKDNSVDTILALNVFEHVFNFQLLLSECHRVLKKNGQLVIATPFLKEIHDLPADHFRYTPQSWQILLNKSGFIRIYIQPIGCSPVLSAYSQLQNIIPTYINILTYLLANIIDRALLQFRPEFKDIYLAGVLAIAYK